MVFDGYFNTKTRFKGIKTFSKMEENKGTGTVISIQRPDLFPFMKFQLSLKMTKSLKLISIFRIQKKGIKMKTM